MPGARLAAAERGLLPCAGRALLWPSSALVAAAFREEFKPQRPRDRCCFREPHTDPVTEPMGLAAPLVDERMPVLVIPEILSAEGACGDETVSAGVVELDEQ